MLDTTLLNREERQDAHEMLKNLPENESIFKCQSCKQIFNIYTEGLLVFMALAPKDNIICPNCKTSNVELMCRVDIYSLFLKLSGFKCRDGQPISGVDICPVCHTNLCPRCFNHDCLGLSRVTGYMSAVSGWNAAKKQELIDRKRYEIGKPKILACKDANMLAQC